MDLGEALWQLFIPLNFPLISLHADRIALLMVIVTWAFSPLFEIWISNTPSIYFLSLTFVAEVDDPLPPTTWSNHHNSHKSPTIDPAFYLMVPSRCHCNHGSFIRFGTRTPSILGCPPSPTICDRQSVCIYIYISWPRTTIWSKQKENAFVTDNGYALKYN